MTIAGSDSGAGAGVQADLKTFAAHGVFGTSVITALTAQNTAEVLGVRAIDPAFVDLQITAVLDDLPVASVKTGMLANASIIAAVARRAAAGELPNLVVDPVLVSWSGHPLLDEGGVRAYLDLLLPHTDVLTPNTREASLLTGSAVGNLDEMIAAGRALCDRGARTVIVKGGHLPGDIAPDVVVGPDETLVLEGTRVVSANDHGTGCTLSAAVAALLARGSPLSDAVRQAKSFVRTALEGASSWHLGRGHGPLDHFGWGAGE
jgi:hydroxymethylpyrimidine/phosphomethylpyrimidine kinase